jgi:transposase-like protein
MLRIPKARKEAILNKMMSPYPPTIVVLSKQEGISEATLYNWRKQLRQEGRPVPEHDRTSENWSAQTKFAVVVETAAMTETELAEYCRGKGLYPEQVKAWRDTAIASQDESQQATAASQQQGRDYRKQIKRLETDLARKEKALAEAAALLILQKKMRALWEGGEDE